MMTEQVTFGAMRELLLQLGFVEKVLPEGQSVFLHKPTDTLLAFRPYRPDELLDWHHVASARHHLDYRGLLTPEAFERRLREPAA